MNFKIKYLLLFIPFLLLASTDDRALYVKKYSKELKTALVIGNSNYKHFSVLKNSKNDAKDMKALLQKQGFKVHYLQDATLRQMEKGVRKFAFDIKNGGIGMVYYAGHGVEVDGKNYLIPVDAEIPAKNEVKYEALAVNMLIDKMEDARNRLNILVLDACRNDPFSRSGGGGLAAINNAKGMYVAYATAPGEVASDGSGSNGLFTKHLMNEMQKPQTLEKVFKNTRLSVLKESNDKQLPWTSSSVTGDFYFTIPSASVKATPNRNSYPQQQSSFSFSDDAPKTFSLTINTDPSYAKVQITNIKPKYYDGIKLVKGNYDIKVSADGYYSKTGLVDLKSDLLLKISLKKEEVVFKETPKSIYSSKSYSSSSIIKDKYGNTYKTVISPYTGKVWLDRNLGAKRVCTSYNDSQCYGDYFQWGRDADGHEKKNSSTTSSISSSSTPNYSRFIKSNKANRYDWISSQNDNLWQGISGTNNPCPFGYRIPTINELIAETINQGVKNRYGAYTNFLKLPSVGYRNNSSSSLVGQGSYGYVWSSSVNDKRRAGNVYFTSGDAIYNWSSRAYGFSVRCLKD